MSAPVPEQVPPLPPDRLAARRAHLLEELRHHRPRAPRRPVGVAVGAAAAIAASVAVGAVVTLTADSTAFAGWSPVPTAVPAADRPSLAASCLASGQGSNVMPAPTDPSVLAEQRGEARLVLLVGGNDSLMLCLDVPHEGGGGVLRRYSRNPLPGPAQVWSNGYMQNDLAAYHRSYTALCGRVSADVTGLGVRRADGTVVQATVEDGWFVAWWPGLSKPAQFQLTTAGGVVRVPAPGA